MSTDNQTTKTQIIIAVLGLIGVLGAAAIANWDKLFPNPIPTPTLTHSTLPTPTPTLTHSTLPTPTEDPQEYELRLKNAIDLAGNVEAQSLAELNEAPLYQIYKNEALKLRIGLIKTFRNQGVFAIAQRHHIRYDSITIDANKRHAKIRAIPT